MKIFYQNDEMDCGPTCLKIIFYSYGSNLSINTLREFSGISRLGVSIKGLILCAEKFKFNTITAKIFFIQF